MSDEQRRFCLLGCWTFHWQLRLPDEKWLCPWYFSQWGGTKCKRLNKCFMITLYTPVLFQMLSFPLRSWETRFTCTSLKMDTGLGCRISSCTTPSPPTWSDAGSIRSHQRPTLRTMKAKAVLTPDITCTESLGSVWVTAARWRKTCSLAEIQRSGQTALYPTLWLVQTVWLVLSWICLLHVFIYAIYAY